MVKCLTVFTVLSMCCLLTSVALLVRAIVEQANTYEGVCNILDFADPDVCDTCAFVIRAYVPSTRGFLSFTSYDWQAEMAHSLYGNKVYPVGDMFKCCDIDPLDCCNFGTQGNFCDITGGDSSGSNCPNSPWKCTIQRADLYASGGGGTTADAVESRGVRGSHLTIGHDQSVFIFGSSAVAFLYVFLQLQYVRTSWGYISKKIMAFMALMNQMQVFRSLRAKINYITLRRLRKRAPVNENESSTTSTGINYMKRMAKDGVKQDAAAIAIQTWWREGAVARRRKRQLTFNAALGAVGVAESMKSLLEPERLQWMYLSDWRHAGCGHRVTRTNLTYTMGQRIEVLTVMLGPNESMFLRLTKTIHIEDEYPIKGFPGKALRPMVSRVRGLLADRHVTNKHALRTFNGFEVDVRDAQDLTDVVMDFQERPIILEFITVAPEWILQKLRERKAFTRTKTYRNAVPPPTTPYPNPSPSSTDAGPVPSYVRVRPRPPEPVDFAISTIHETRAIDMGTAHEERVSPYRGGIPLPWNDPAYDQHYATIIDIE